MRKQTRVSHPIYNFLPTEIAGFDSLAELALDMSSSWNHATDDVWRRLDPILWELTQNPWVVLQTVSRDQIESVLADPVFRKTVDDLLQTSRQAVEAPAWFQQHHPHSPLNCIAYFSMEFMLSEALPIYSGGLGNVAGDQLKAASDLGLPVVGVGLLYQQGYFRQVIDKDGAQQALFPYNDPGQIAAHAPQSVHAFLSMTGTPGAAPTLEMTPIGYSSLLTIRSKKPEKQIHRSRYDFIMPLPAGLHPAPSERCRSSARTDTALSAAVHQKSRRSASISPAQGRHNSAVHAAWHKEPACNNIEAMSEVQAQGCNITGNMPITFTEYPSRW
jgi:hypothetical protein